MKAAGASVRVGGKSVGDFRCGGGSGGGHQTLDDVRQFGPDLGQAVEVVLALTARGDDPAVTEQGQVVADGRLALAELRAKGTDVLLAIGQDQDHLEPGRVADMLQEDRSTLGLLRSLISGLDRLGLRRCLRSGGLRSGARLRCHVRNLSHPEARHIGVNRGVGRGRKTPNRTHRGHPDQHGHE